MTNARNVMIVNNTNADIRPFDAAIRDAATRGEFPEDLADVFAFQFVTVAGQLRVILNWK